MPKKISLLLILIFWGMSPILAAEEDIIPSFINYHSAAAEVTWEYRTNKGNQVVNGIFSVTLPHSYALFITDSQNYGQKINGYRDIIAVHSLNGKVEYQYESIQLFSVYNTLFNNLIEQTGKPTQLVEFETMGGRNVARYQQQSSHTYWFDRETNIPLRITDEKGNNILSLRQYQVDSDYKKGVESFTLAITDGEWEGIIRLGKKLEQWFPLELQVGDENSDIIVTFSHWRLLDTPLEFKDLTRLEYLVKQSDLAFIDADWKETINLSRQLLNIDPFYLPAYIRLALSYAKLGDYLATVENYQQWLVLEPENPVALNNLAYTYMKAGINYNKGIKLAYQAVTIEPRATYLDTLGYGYYLIKDYDKALYYLLQAEKLAESQEELLDVYDHLVLVYEALEDQEKVLNYKEKIIFSGELMW